MCARYSNLPKGRGLHCVNLFLYLWAKNENGYTCPLVRIPNTIIIRNGDIRFWFYMGERSEQDTPRESEAFEIKVTHPPLHHPTHQFPVSLSILQSP
jgi:hypothetical protein